MLPEFSIHVSQIHLKFSSSRIELSISRALADWESPEVDISNLMQHSTTIDTSMFKKTTFGECLSGIQASFPVRQLFEGFH